MAEREYVHCERCKRPAPSSLGGPPNGAPESEAGAWGTAPGDWGTATADLAIICPGCQTQGDYERWAAEAPDP